MGLPAESRSPEVDDLERIKREESFGLRREVMRAEMLVTHESPDIDALMSLVIAQLYRRFMGARDASGRALQSDIPISFVPGGNKDFPPGTLALDIGEGRGLRSTPSGGFMLKASAAGGSCCMAVARLLRSPDFDIIKTLIQEVSVWDENGREKSAIERVWSRHRLWPYQKDKNALICTSIFDAFQSLRHASFDYELYELFLRLMEGTIARGHKRNFSTQRNPWDGVETFYGKRFAILPIGASIYTAKALEKQGVEVSLHAVPLKDMRDTWSMALHRSGSAVMDLDTMFRGKMDDFPEIHINSFLVGWGAKGRLRASEPELRLIRDRFIQRAKSILEPWYSSARH